MTEKKKKPEKEKEAKVVELPMADETAMFVSEAISIVNEIANSMAGSLKFRDSINHTLLKRMECRLPEVKVDAKGRIIR